MNNWVKWGRPVLIVAAVLLGYRLYSVMTSRERVRQAPLGASFEYDLEKYNGSDPAALIASETGLIAVPLAIPTGIAVGRNDTIYVTGDASIVVFSRAGETLRQRRVEGNPLCIDAGDDRLYVGFMDHVRVYGTNLQEIAVWEQLGRKAVVTSVAVAGDSVFVADAVNAVVLRFSAAGKLLHSVGAKDPENGEPGFVIPSPYFDVAIAPDDTLWVVDPGRHELRNYTYDGKRRSSWQKASMTIEGFCGCCNPSHIAIREDGSFVTSEKGFVRVKIYNEIGQMQGVVAGSDQFEAETRGLDLAVDSRGRMLVLDPERRQVRIFEEHE